MESFLREHSVGSVIRSAFRIYSQHYPTLFLVYTLPTFPTVVMQQEAEHAQNVGLFAVAAVLNLFLGFFAFGAITVAISDICVGERPNVLRSYRKVFGPTAWKLLWSSFLQMVTIMAGIILLIIPGLVLMIRLLLTPTAVVLENRSGVAALKRSSSLGKGYHWRNAGVLFVFFTILMGTYVVFGFVFGLGAAFADQVNIIEHWAFRTMLAVLIMGVLYPLMFIVIILLYYDLRVRKEAYDVHALAEDLRR